MKKRGQFWVCTLLAAAGGLLYANFATATGVPISGFYPMVGTALTNEFNDDLDTSAHYSTSPSGIFLGQGGTAHYDIALVDTGAAVSLLTTPADTAFNISGPYAGQSDGFRGTETIQIGGATGTLDAEILDPLGLYAGGLAGRTGAAPFVMSNASLKGQTNTSMITIPPESDLPNVVGLSFASQYATYIRSDMPQIFQQNGRTVRSPQIEFNTLGTGGQGIARRAPLALNPGSSFTQPPFWFYNIANFDIDHPEENPSQPTVLQGGLYLTTNVSNNGNTISNSQFLLDTGADVTVLSEQKAFSQLLLDPNHPDFTVAVIGSGGTQQDVPGYFIQQFTIQAVGGDGNLTLTNVPVVVLDVTNPADPGNVVDGIVGTSVLAGRNLVIDPNPSTGGGGVGPSLYIGDPVTSSKDWSSTASLAQWGTGSSWSGGTTPGSLSVTNVRHVSGGNQTADVVTDATVWELNVSSPASQTMTVLVESGVRLATFSGVNIETGGVIQLSNGTLDAQFVEVAGGTLRGAGIVTTGSGPIDGQVENRTGTVAPGNGIGTLSIKGRFASAAGATLAIDLGGTTAGTQYDQLLVDGSVALDGALAVSLLNAFVPTAGNSFTILTATHDMGGTFSQLILPDGQNWMVNYLTNSVQLVVGNPGDFNNDGKVDGQDYVVWRKDALGPLNLLAWRSHFGATYSGSGAGVNASIPEPSGIFLTILAASGLAFVRKRPIPRARSSASIRCARRYCR